MGGWGDIRFVDARGREEATRVARAAEDEARRIEWKYSRYREASVVSQINRDAGRTPVAVDEETDALVGETLALWRLTAGRFDPTVGALRRVWNFAEGRVPRREEVASLLSLVDARALSQQDGTVFLRKPGMEIDLGGVGKEYAVDRVADLLRAEGVESAIVDFAGDVRLVGRRGDGQPWRVGVRHPRARARCAFVLRFDREAGVATSGDSERFFVSGGVRYHHLIDATTGWPARGVASATVVAPTAFRAGCLSTASFLLGPEAGLALLEATPGVEGALITEEGAIRATTGMSRLATLPRDAFPLVRSLERRTEAPARAAGPLRP